MQVPGASGANTSMAAGQAVAMAPAPQSQASQALSGAQIICEYSSQFIPEVITINKLKKERITLHILLSQLASGAKSVI